MPTYIYKVRDEDGKAIEGTMDAASEEELTNRLRKLSYMPVSISKLSREVSPENSSDTAGIMSRYRKIKSQDMIVFNMQLSGMVGAGITLLNSLNIISKQIENQRFKNVINSIIQSVAGGSNFSDALSQHPDIFSKLYISMIKAGEASGNLDTILTRLANYLENQEDLNNKIKGALFYPTILVAVGALVVVIIVSFVLPKFVTIFDRAQISIPLPTQILYVFGIGVKKFWYIFIIGGYLISLGIKKYISHPIGRLQFDKTILRLPIIGPLIRQVVTSRFSRTLATLVESGVSMLQALDIIVHVVGNEIFSGVIKNVRRSVEKGEGLSAPLMLSGEFPADAVHMISVGEETGKLGNMLNKIADFYDANIGFAVRKLTALIEPFFIVIMGIVVGFIMAAMLLPLFDMVKTIQR